MFNLQGSEIIVILLLALVVLGPEKLPDAVRKFSQTYGELKKMGSGFQTEMKSVLDEPLREMRETADLVKNAADPSRVVDDAESEARVRAEADAAMLAATPDVPVSDEALAVSDPVAQAEAEAEVEPVSGKKINQIAASMARGPIDPDPVEQQPSEVVVTPTPLTERPAGAPAALAPPTPGEVAVTVPPPEAP